MTGALKFRLAAFVLAIAGMVGLIVWTAQSAWQRAGELRERFTSVQLESFKIADHFQETILGLNNLVLRYGVYHNTNDWARFDAESTALDHWIDEERPSLSTEQERQILDLINTNYDYYIAAARAIHTNAAIRGQGAAPLAEFAQFEKQSQKILQFGLHLGGAHRDSMKSFLSESNRALNYLRLLLVGSLTFLLLAGAGLAAVVYRDLVAPLRIRLVENQALMERQEKLASLGMLAAGVAHEIRNPLTAIKAWLYIQRKQLQPGSPEAADADLIANELARLENIVKDVLLFARPSEPHLVTVPAGEPLQQAEALMAPQVAKSGIRLVRENSESA